jgi:membrane-associated phospholipid phosphatase
MSVDQTILTFFTNTRVEWLSFVMLVITYSASYIVVSGVTLLSIISFYIHKHYARILPFLVAVCGSALTTFILKDMFSRTRPAGAFYLESSFSFPSGHATAAMALYGFLLYTIWKHDKHILKKPFMVFLLALIALVGTSRLYLGVHYLSDVWAGYAVGFVWLLLSIKLHKYLLNWEQFKSRLKSNN